MTSAYYQSLAQARRNQLFEDKPASATAQCPLAALEVAIFPVRYALDESPPKGSAQGPNPLPAGFDATHLPTLDTRSYTLRQLRNGWLYLWDEVERTFHEYRVQGHLLTRQIWGDGELGQDQRNNPGETRPYLLYPRRSRLRMAWSPVQWTWRLCELMRSHRDQQAQWMRELDLDSYCRSFQAAHGAPLRTLAEAVADISSDGAVPGFETTLVPGKGEPASEQLAMQIKPGISDALILGAVPDQDTALFIALDDPLAIIQDLNMQLTGRMAEIALFEAQHRNPLQSAMAVHQACGVDLDNIMPSTVKEDLQQRLAFTDDAHRFLSSHARLHQGVQGDIGGAAGALHAHQIDAETMRNRWQLSHDHPAWNELSRDWHSKDTWRNDVRYDEVCTFLHERADELLQLRRHVLASEADLIRWLTRLRPEAEALFHDPCNREQSIALLEWAEGITQSLGGCGIEEADTAAQDSSILRLARIELQGQTWLYRQMNDQNSLIGLSLFNFNRELAQALDQIAWNYSITGTLDGVGLQPDASGQINTGSDFWQEVLKGAENTDQLLSLEAVQNSRLYQSLSDSARLSLETLRQVAAEPARELWGRLSSLFLPAHASNHTTAVRALSFSLTQVLVSPEIADFVGLQLNRDFLREQQQWQRQQQTLLNQQRGLQAALGRPGQWYDKQSARTQLTAIRQELLEHASQQPRHIQGIVRGRVHIENVSIQQVEALLLSAGQSELHAQQYLKTSNPAAHAARAKAWIDLNLGGSLPLLLAALGLWNLMVTSQAVHHDGYLSGEEQNQLLTSIATSGSLLMALMVMPLWARVGNMTGVIDGDTFKLTRAGARVWLKEGQLAHAKLAQRLITRTAGMAALNVIAAASEIVQINRQMGRATSQEQILALQTQRAALRVMAIGGGLQLVGSLSGLYFNFAWVMGGWMVGLLAIAGLVYLVASVLVSLYHREGLRLWLHQCHWGKAAASLEDTDEAHGQSLWKLAQICLTPGVTVRSTSHPYWNELDGAWLQLNLPAQLAGQHCAIKAVFVRKTGGFLASRQPITLAPGTNERLSGGYWASGVEDDPLSHMPPPRNNDKLAGDISYTVDAGHYHWRTWIPVSGASYVELEISYPDMIEQSTQQPMCFTFRARLNQASRNAELISDPLTDAPIEGELLSRSGAPPQMIRLPVPTTES